MPFTFSVAEYEDMIYVYGFCDGNSVHAVAEYQQRFPNRRIPNRRVFTRVYQTLRDTGTLPGVRIAAERGVNEGVDEEEGVVQMVQNSPRASTQRIIRRLPLPHTRVWRTLHAEDHTTCSECNISDLPILLRGWSFASGSMTVTSCIITSCLLKKRDSVATVSIIHTTVMCGQMRIPTPLSKATFNNVLVSMCCAVLDDQLIGPFILEGRLTGEAYLRFLQEELPRRLENVTLNKRGRMYFQHDGAPTHSSREIRNFLNYHFPGRWIGRGGPYNWPARSPDLSPQGYCVWGWMKELVYSVKVVTGIAALPTVGL